MNNWKNWKNEILEIVKLIGGINEDDGEERKMWGGETKKGIKGEKENDIEEGKKNYGWKWNWYGNERDMKKIEENETGKKNKWKEGISKKVLWYLKEWGENK